MTSTIDISMTIGEIVAARPELSRIFERINIDYCCGGNRSLESACREKGLDPQTVVVLLEAGLQNDGQKISNVASLSIRELITHITDTHHRFLREELPRILTLSEKVASAHGERNPALHRVQALCRRLATEMPNHLDEEETKLFPTLADANANGVSRSQADLIASLEEDHQEVGATLEELRNITAGYEPPEWGCNTYRALMDGLRRLEEDTHQHVHKENNILFPKVLNSPATSRV